MSCPLLSSPGGPAAAEQQHGGGAAGGREEGAHGLGLHHAAAPGISERTQRRHTVRKLRKNLPGFSMLA